MKVILIIILVALIPASLSLVMIRRAKRRFSMRMRRIRQMNLLRSQNQNYLPPSLSDSFERYCDTIGNTQCRFNAHSPYIRCAVNPSGPCDNCSFFEEEK